MKTNYFLLIIICIISPWSYNYCQSNGSLLIISATPCEISIDGEARGSCSNSQPVKSDLGPGEHLILATAIIEGRNTEKIEVVIIEPGIQKVIRISFGNQEAETPQSNLNSIPPKQIANINFNLDGTMTAGTWMNEHPGLDYPNYPIYYYAFEKGDVIELTVTMTNRNGTNSIEIATYPEGLIKYSNRSFQSLEKIKIPVERRSIYKISFSTNALLDRNCTMILNRIPSTIETSDFNCLVVTRRDTTFTEVLDRSFNITASTSKGYCEVLLPNETDFWVYWIGVGQEATQAFQAFGANLPRLGQLAGVTNPLVFFGLGLIGELPKLSGDDDITYKFMNNENLNLWWDGYEYRHYTFGYGEKIISEYKKVLSENTPTSQFGKLYMTFYNDNLFYATKVSVKIVAFKVVETLEINN